jgi:hypothetical protein
VCIDFPPFPPLNPSDVTITPSVGSGAATVTSSSDPSSTGDVPVKLEVGEAMGESLNGQSSMMFSFPPGGGSMPFPIMVVPQMPTNEEGKSALLNQQAQLWKTFAMQYPALKNDNSVSAQMASLSSLFPPGFPYMMPPSTTGGGSNSTPMLFYPSMFVNSATEGQPVAGNPIATNNAPPDFTEKAKRTADLPVKTKKRKSNGTANNTTFAEPLLMKRTCSSGSADGGLGLLLAAAGDLEDSNPFDM